MSLQHEMRKRTYNINGKHVKDSNVPPNKEGSTRDNFEYLHSKVTFEHNQTWNKMIVKVNGNVNPDNKTEDDKMLWFDNHVKLEVTKNGPLRREAELKVDDQVVTQFDGRIGK
ncbi:unnamed protein product [Caenorhabditis brenneri]